VEEAFWAPGSVFTAIPSQLSQFQHITDGIPPYDQLLTRAQNFFSLDIGYNRQIIGQLHHVTADYVLPFMEARRGRKLF
jgi:hypothetical protein